MMIGSEETSRQNKVNLKIFGPGRASRESEENLAKKLSVPQKKQIQDRIQLLTARVKSLHEIRQALTAYIPREAPEVFSKNPEDTGNLFARALKESMKAAHMHAGQYAKTLSETAEEFSQEISGLRSLLGEDFFGGIQRVVSRNRHRKAPR